MKKIILLIFTIVAVASCNDGDLIVTSFNLENQPLQRCGPFGNFVFFQINSNPAESLSVKITSTDSIFNMAGQQSFALSTTNTANYRSYDGPITNTYFCNNIPPATPKVITEYIATSGMVRLTNFIIFEDNDGIVEDVDNTKDTDGDGIPDYYDFDDDGDNVLTSTEIGPDPLIPRDSDGDLIPDYLDNDDDGDGILTIDEDADGDLNPANDFTIQNGMPDYLNEAVTVNHNITRYRSHRFTKQTNIGLSLIDALLIGNGEEILQQTIDMGELDNVQMLTKNVTPTFTPPALRSEIYKPQ